ncbi:MAG: PaaI family thioesterase [Rhodobacteraceae bacterium]|nr:PaaI family thioesterase [Paracoccaceae bacterium]
MKLQFSISELSSYLDEVFPQVVNRYRIVDLQQGYARVIQNITQENLRPGGTVSGPTIFSLVDIGMYILLLAHIGKEPLAVTTNCSIDFLKKPTMDEELFADCNLLKLGKTLVFGEVLVKSSEKETLLARSSITYYRPKPQS